VDAGVPEVLSALVEATVDNVYKSTVTVMTSIPVIEGAEEDAVVSEEKGRDALLAALTAVLDKDNTSEEAAAQRAALLAAKRSAHHTTTERYPVYTYYSFTFTFKSTDTLTFTHL
jgi:hypothetical protein